MLCLGVAAPHVRLAQGALREHSHQLSPHHASLHSFAELVRMQPGAVTQEWWKKPLGQRRAAKLMRHVHYGRVANIRAVPYPLRQQKFRKARLIPHGFPSFRKAWHEVEDR